MRLYEEHICFNALNRIFGFAPRTARALLEHFGSASAIFAEKNLGDALPYTKGADRINDAEYGISEKEISALGASGAAFIHMTDPCYPAPLRECEDAPMGFYWLGSSPPQEIFGRRPAVSIVGTRDCSAYGREWCERTVCALAGSAARPTIVSGLALGVDITAHRKALGCGLPTIAVMATGIDAVYPHVHRRDAMRIRNTEGCALITDFPPGTAPLACHFLRRNRIIAGISEATILVESGLRGGGMMTARLASSYSRDVYALPGRVDDPHSLGCNALIRDKIAEPLFPGTELPASLGRIPPARQPQREDGISRYEGILPDDRTDILSRILLTVRKNRGIGIDEIAAAAGIPYRQAASLVSLLENDGMISVDISKRCSIRIN